MISSSFASMEVRLSDPCFLELVAVSSIVILATFHSFHIEDSGVLEPVALWYRFGYEQDQDVKFLVFFC